MSGVSQHRSGSNDTDRDIGLTHSSAAKSRDGVGCRRHDGHRSSRDHTVRATDGETLGKSWLSGTSGWKALVIKVCGSNGHEVTDETSGVGIFVGK